MATVTDASIEKMKALSPLRNSTTATTLEELVDEQLEHFGISPTDEYGQTLRQIVSRLYENQRDIDHLWNITIQALTELPTSDRIRRFNAKKFLSFQLAKLLDTVQHPFRKSYQSLG